MTSKEAIDKIKKLLFGEESFGSYKTKDGVEMSIDGEVKLGKEIYIITSEGNIPAPDEMFEFEDGLRVKVKDGLIEKIDYSSEEKEEMAEATLADGTRVTNDEAGEFAVGQNLYVITEDNEKVSAPQGEHSTESGITIVVDENGVITGIKRPDEEGEGSLEEMAEATLVDGTIVETEGDLSVGSELYVRTESGRTIAPDGQHSTTEGKIIVVENGVITEIMEREEESQEDLYDVITEGFNALKNEINTLREDYNKIKSEFSAFKGEPAGERQYNNNEYIKELKAQKFRKLEELRSLRNKNK